MSLDVFLQDPETKEVLFEANITHNVASTAARFLLFTCCWRPEELHIRTASDLLPRLDAGILRLATNLDELAAGLDDEDCHFFAWILRYRVACSEHPQALVSVSR